ncbi:MAG: 5'/3'-nucleotidase SurE [Firmicutes bacterium]|nr:5'/3'-nucleotidase SurE [Bacillota bacterium]
MRILVTNDDGIEALGIRQLVEALARVPGAEVYVAAPARQQSAKSHGITVHGEMEVEEVEYPWAKKAWKIDGTPADCADLGLEFMKMEGIPADILYSGINHGANVGTDILYSGTVGAAIEGLLNGVPAVAVSADRHFRAEFTPEDFAVAANAAAQLLPVALEAGTDFCLNLNAPSGAAAEVKGWKITSMGPREYEGGLHRGETFDGKTTFSYAGTTPKVYTDLSIDYDVMAVQEGYISVTPIARERTFEKVKEYYRALEAWEVR